MSREAWGDEGNIANSWEETLIRSEMDAAVVWFSRWMADYRAEFPSVEFAALADHVINTFDEMQAMLSGKI